MGDRTNTVFNHSAHMNFLAVHGPFFGEIIAVCEFRGNILPPSESSSPCSADAADGDISSGEGGELTETTSLAFDEVGEVLEGREVRG